MPVSLLEADAQGGESLLYPRLGREIGRALVREYDGQSLSDLRERGSLDHPSAAPAPTGGTPASPAQLEILQRTIREVADAAGFPVLLRRGGEQAFDRPCGEQIYRVMGIVPADAASEDVWTFISTVLVPEIAPWRFPDRAEDRLLGRPRNALRRVWWRAWSLGPDLEFAPEGCTPLGEDEFVQIMERSLIGYNRRTARAVRDAIWRLEVGGLPAPRPEVMRQLTRRFRAFMPYICMDAITDEELSALLDEVGAAALTALRSD